MVKELIAELAEDKRSKSFGNESGENLRPSKSVACPIGIVAFLIIVATAQVIE
jgi:hypothetical protein